MARGVNKVIIVGNCGQDPETRFMPSGGAVTNLSIATSESWKDKNTGDQQERTEWHRVVFFNRLAEIAGEYVKKGSKLYIEGSLRTIHRNHCTPKWKTSLQWQMTLRMEDSSRFVAHIVQGTVAK